MTALRYPEGWGEAGAPALALRVAGPHAAASLRDVAAHPLRDEPWGFVQHLEFLGDGRSLAALEVARLRRGFPLGLACGSGASEVRTVVRAALGGTGPSRAVEGEGYGSNSREAIWAAYESALGSVGLRRSGGEVRLSAPALDALGAAADRAPARPTGWVESWSGDIAPRSWIASDAPAVDPLRRRGGAAIAVHFDRAAPLAAATAWSASARRALARVVPAAARWSIVMLGPGVPLLDAARLLARYRGDLLR